jgi:hypothetical protein
MGLEPNNKWILTGRYWVRLSDGYRLPVIQGGGAVNFVQNDKYAFGDDDGNEAGHSLDSENTDRAAQEADVTFLIRIQLEETASGNATYTHALFAQVNGGGGFAAVTTTSENGVILANDTQSRADDENTTERLTYGGTGAWQAGKYDDGQTQLGTTAFKCDDEYTEVEFAIQIDSGNASDTDDFEFRVEQTDGTDFDGYPGSYPTATASISAGDPQIDEDADLTIGENVEVTPLVLPNLTESDDVTIGDTVIDIEVVAGAPDRDIDVDSDITLGESTSVSIDDEEVSETDDVTIGDTLPTFYLDTIVIGEVVTVAFEGAAPDRDIDVDDGITLGESTAATLDDLAVDESDDVTIGETTTAKHDDLELSKSDDITIGENITVEADRDISETDDITLGESTDAELPDALAIDVSDGLTIGDAPALAMVDETIDVSDGVTLGESTAVNRRAAWYNPDSITINVGSIKNGNVESTWADDGTKLQLAETTGNPGFDYEFNFFDVPANAESIAINGYYEGNVGHTVKIQQWNFTGVDWTDLTGDAKDFPHEITDQDYEFSLFNDADYNDGGEVRLRIYHPGGGTNTHNFYIDHFLLTTNPVVDITDDIIFGENVTVSLPDALEIDTSDDITVGEYTKVFSGGDFEVDVSDDITFGESTTALLPDALGIDVTDDITLGKNVTASIGLDISTTSGIAIGENTAVTISDPTLSVSDGLTIGESTSVVINLTIDVSDGITLGESVTWSMPDLTLALSDNVTIADVANVVTAVALVESWTLQSRSQDWTIEDRDLDWSIQDRSTAWTVEDR